MTVQVIPSWPLAGLSVTTTNGIRVVFVTPDDGDDEDGTGVREPRRPRPGPPTLTMEATP